MPLSREASWWRVELTVLQAGDGGMLSVSCPLRSLRAIGVTSGEGDPVVCVCDVCVCVCVCVCVVCVCVCSVCNCNMIHLNEQHTLRYGWVGLNKHVLKSVSIAPLITSRELSALQN